MHFHIHPINILISILLIRFVRPQHFDTICTNRPNGFFARDPNNSHHYYACVDGQAHHGECPLNYFFNQHRQVCDSDATRICEGVSNDRLVSNPASTNSYYRCTNNGAILVQCAGNMPFEEDKQSCKHTAEFDESHLCDNAANLVFINDPLSCDGYYYCLDRIPIKGKCDYGYYFQQSTQVCLSASSTNCHLNDGPINDNPVNDNPPTPPQPDYPIDNPILDKNNYCNQVIDHLYVSDPESCDGYYLCINREALFGKCYEGYYFDQSKQNCLLASYVQCALDQRPPVVVNPPHNHTHALCEHVLDNIYIIDPDTCDGFFLCLNQQPIHGRCNLGHSFSQANQKCLASSQVQCHLDQRPPPPLNDDPIEYQCPAVGVFQVPYPNSCNRYILCFNGRSALFECAHGFQFDQTIQKCNLEEVVKCRINYCVANQNLNQITLHSHPNDCQKYIVCYSGSSMEMECANGFFYNPLIQTCDFRVNVDCVQPVIYIDNPNTYESINELIYPLIINNEL